MPATHSLRFALAAALAVLIVLLFAAPSATQQQLQATTTPGAPATVNASASISTYGQIPLSFEANRGQTDASVQFLSRGYGYTLFLEPGEAVLALASPKPAAKAASPGEPREGLTPRTGDVETSYVRIRLVGTNAGAAVREEDQQITKTNYFIGSDPSKWRTNIPNFGRIRYAGVYPGIDLIYYGNQNGLEDDFVVSPGADPSRVVLALDGLSRPRIDSATGDLILHTGSGEVRLLRPIAYQESNGRHDLVSSAYKLVARNQVGFAVASYDHSRPLVIDPVLVYSTFLGSDTRITSYQGYPNGAAGIAVDSSGSAYVVGTTSSPQFPVTAGAFQKREKSSGSETAFVTKVNATGTALVYSTYLGGSNGDYGYAVALDQLGEAYITGATYSTDFPITCGAFETSNIAAAGYGDTTGFVTRLSAAGNALIYSTYLGSEAYNYSGFYIRPADVPEAIAVNSSGYAYVAGYTDSAGFPVTAGAIQPEFASSQDGFVAELNPSGTGLVYSTFFGSDDSVNAIAIDSAGEAYIAGTVGSNGNSGEVPVSPGAFQPAAKGSPTAFVAKVNPTATGLIYSTYVGGSNKDSAQSIAIDGNGLAYIAGYTSSSDFPLTDGVLEAASSRMSGYLVSVTEPNADTPGYGPVGFLTKLSRDGSSLEYSTYIEGLGTRVNGLAVDSSGAAYLTGSAATQGGGGGFAGFKTTLDALKTPTSTGTSAFVVKVDPAAKFLNYATLLGGSEDDFGFALALDSLGNVYITGAATSPDFPITPGAFQTKNNTSAFVSKFALASEQQETSYPVLPPTPISTTVTAEGGDPYVPAAGTWVTHFDGSMTAEREGPTPTGYMELDANGFDYGDTDTFVPWPDSTSIESSFWNGVAPPASWTVSIFYTGNGVYSGSQASCTGDGDGCSTKGSSSVSNADSSDLLGDMKRSWGILARKSRVYLGPSAIQDTGITSGARFSPPLLQPSGARKPVTDDLPVSDSSPACIAPPKMPPLTVTLHVASPSRLYGEANPSITYSMAGLLSGDIVTVSPYTAAIPSSPVGRYPVSALISGAAALKYNLKVVDATLTVKKAPLAVIAQDAYQLSGQIPGNFNYVFSGFVNGDTASVIAGEALLTTTATAASRAGAYPIHIEQGSLATENYSFTLQSGVLNIFEPIDVGSAAVGATISRRFSFPYGPASPLASIETVTTGESKPEFSGATLTKSPADYTAQFSFSPHAPGLWIGSIELLDGSKPANTLVTIPVGGAGHGPQLVFASSEQAAVQPTGHAALVNPAGVTWDAVGTIYISDAGSNQIVVVSGKSASVLNTRGVPLNNPSAVAIDGDGNLYVANTGNNSIVEINSAGNAWYVDVNGLKLAGPRGVAVDRESRLIIADTGNNRIVRVSAAGTVSVFATGALKLSGPTGLTTDSSGDLYIADTGNNRIVEVTLQGVATVVNTGTPALSSPVGIAVDPAGSLYVTESGDRLVQISPIGRQTTLRATGLSRPSGISLDHSGVLYVADSGNKRILEMQGPFASPLSFASTTAGVKSADSPQELTVQNIGTSALTISSVAFPPDFPEDASGKNTDCKAGKTISPGAACTLTIDFKPSSPLTTRASLSLKESAVITSDTLNDPGTQQALVLEGTEIQ